MKKGYRDIDGGRTRIEINCYDDMAELKITDLTNGQFVKLTHLGPEIREWIAASIGNGENMRHGKWVKSPITMFRNDRIQCSECGMTATVPKGELAHYCPNCGARMDK